MPRARSLLVVALTAMALLSHTRPTTAQEVRWRHDYAAARKEATETGRPLFFDVGTEACFWCKKLDATTFRDPRVVQILNERFVPVKIDAGKDARLANGLGAEGYPTLVVATPDGKVAGRHAGYADTAQLTALMSKAPAPGPAARPPGETEPNTGLRTKDQIEAELAALFPKIAAGLDR